MLRRRLSMATLTAALLGSLVAIAPATSTAASADPSRTPAATAAPTPVAPQIVEEPPAPAAVMNRATDTASLLRYAGLAPTAKPGATTSRVVTEGSVGGNLIPGVARHVNQACDTANGGERVQVMYVREADVASRYADVVPVIRNEVRTVDDTFAVSSAQTNGGRRVRWMFDADCQINVEEVVVPDGALTGDFRKTRNAMVALGYDNPARKYLMFADVRAGSLGSFACAFADSFGDSRPTADNQNNGAFAMFARLDLECWVRAGDVNFSAATHELMHTLGAVQPEAPTFGNSAHCTDFYDVMCVPDLTRVPSCPEYEYDYFDCRKDTYFHTAPAPGSWLATHWNTANSRFLDTAPVLAKPSLSVSGSRTAAQTGDPVTFTASVAPGTSVQWQTTNPDCAASAPTGPTFVVNCPFNYSTQTITAVASSPDVDGTAIVRTTLGMTNAPDPVMSTTSPNQAVAGQPFTQTVTMTQGKGPFVYEWSNANASCTASTPTNTTTYTRTCPTSAIGTTVNSNIKVTSADKRITTMLLSTKIVAAGPTVTIAGPANVPDDTAATFTTTAEGATNPTYLWTSSRGWITSTSTGSAVTVTPPQGATGSDTLTVTLTNGDGSTATSQTTYTVVKAFTMALNAPTTLNQGTQGSLSVDLSRAATVTWGDDQAACSIATTSTTSATLTCAPSFLGPVTITATGTATDASIMKSATIQVVDPSIMPSLSLNVPADAHSGITVPVSVENTGAPVTTWQWSASAANCFTGPTSTQSVTLQCPLAYFGALTVNVTGTTADGQSSTVTKTVNMIRPSIVPSVVMPDSVYIGNKAGVTATIRTAETGAPVKAVMALQRSTDGGNTWANVIGAALVETGTLSTTVAPTVTTAFRVISPGTGIMVSKVLKVVKRPAKLTIGKAGTVNAPVITGKFVDTLTGKGVSGKNVSVQVQYSGTTTWKTVAQVVTGSTGEIRKQVSPPKFAKYRLKTPSDSRYASMLSGTVSVAAVN